MLSELKIGFYIPAEDEYLQSKKNNGQNVCQDLRKLSRLHKQSNDSREADQSGKDGNASFRNQSYASPVFIVYFLRCQICAFYEKRTVA